MTTYLDGLKNSTIGIIILGAAGSLLSAAIAFAMKALLDQYRRIRHKTFYNFGWMNGFCHQNPERLPIYVTFLISFLAKIIIQSTVAIGCLIIVSVSVVEADTISYLASVTFLTLAIFFMILSYSDYKSIVFSYKRSIDKVLDEGTEDTKTR